MENPHWDSQQAITGACSDCRDATRPTTGRWETGQDGGIEGCSLRKFIILIQWESHAVTNLGRLVRSKINAEKTRACIYTRSVGAGVRLGARQDGEFVCTLVSRYLCMRSNPEYAYSPAFRNDLVEVTPSFMSERVIDFRLVSTSKEDLESLNTLTSPSLPFFTLRIALCSATNSICKTV
ncbi:hypothetical protein EVAR_38817_1 [Eumeta japonica]|uniref:Uncharacterized protein n=1 Tax=Eumeta variegata TaxID=151549 RepID=A0A4C1XTG4_EUMVA|nr:hypothetical protein EVAR_38817_1 [Eumeta japonica]